MSISSWKKVLVAGAAALAVTAGAGAVVAQDGGGAVAPVAPETRVGVGSPPESVFVPITPCRVVNTATSGAGRIAPGQTRVYETQGDTSGQGGAELCPIPAYASALEVNITAPSAAGNGYLRVAPAGVAIPNATFMNYTSSFNVSNAGTVAITPGRDANLQVRAFGSATHLVIDVLGYHLTENLAVVNADGTLNRANGVTGLHKIGTGQYDVRFAKHISGCTWTATLSQPGWGAPPTGTVSTSLVLGAVDGVLVETRGLDGALANRPFHLVVDC